MHRTKVEKSTKGSILCLISGERSTPVESSPQLEKGEGESFINQLDGIIKGNPTLRDLALANLLDARRSLLGLSVTLPDAREVDISFSYPETFATRRITIHNTDGSITKLRFASFNSYSDGPNVQLEYSLNEGKVTTTSRKRDLHGNRIEVDTYLSPQEWRAQSQEILASLAANFPPTSDVE